MSIMHTKSKVRSEKWKKVDKCGSTGKFKQGRSTKKIRQNEANKFLPEEINYTIAELTRVHMQS